MKGNGLKGSGLVAGTACAALFVVLMTGCSAGLMTIGNVKTSKDAFTGITSDRMVANPLSCVKESLMSGAPTIGLILQRSYGKDYKVQYHIIATWYGGGWGYIEGGETLILMVDGKRLGFYGPGSAEHRVVEGAYVSEESWYSSNYEQLGVIADAKEVAVVLKGKNTEVSRCMTPTNLDNFKVFLKYFPPYIAIEGPAR